MLRSLLLLAAALSSPALASGQAPPPPPAPMPSGNYADPASGPVPQAVRATPTVFSGHLDHAPAGDTLQLWYGAPRPAKAALSATGDFRIVVPGLKQPTSASFVYARQHTALYLTPGDQLRVTLDYAKFDETVRYTGRGAAANNYLARSLYEFDYGPAGNVPRPQQLLKATTTPAEIRQYADAFRQRQRAYLAAFVTSQPLPVAFRQQAALDIDLEWGRTLLEYVGYYRYQAPGAALPATYYSFLAQLPLKTLDAQVTREPVLRFLNGYTSRLLPAGVLAADPAAASHLYAQATADFGPGRARDWAVYQALTYQLMVGDAAPVLAAYPTFRAQTRDSTVAQNMRALVQKQLALQPGQPAPAFALQTNEGKTVALADLRGKVVYLDFWGTWCGPCMHELTEFSHDLKKKFEGRDVVFAYISVGDKEEKWQQVLTEKQFLSLNSLHLRSPDQAVATSYQVSAFPTYWLIGRDGRIIQARAPRPSDGAKTVAALEAALQQ